MKAIILFMSSGGFGKTKTLNMTIQDFVDATKDYHDETDIYNVIKTLKKQKNVVPLFRKIRRQKTNRYYYSFCSPETVKTICSYLIKRDNIESNEPLFKRNPIYLSNDFQTINDTLKLGRAEPYRRFRPNVT